MCKMEEKVLMNNVVYIAVSLSGEISVTIKPSKPSSHAENVRCDNERI